MTYSTNPVSDADRHYDALYTAQERQELAEIAAEQDFILACKKGDANAIAEFAGLTTDWDNAPKGPFVHGAVMPKRAQALSEVMADSLDYGKHGPTMSELMQLVLNVAYGNELVNAPEQARALLMHMAKAWAEHNVEVQA